MLFLLRAGWDFGLFVDLTGWIRIDSVLEAFYGYVGKTYRFNLPYDSVLEGETIGKKSKVLFGRNEACCQITSVLPHFFLI